MRTYTNNTLPMLRTIIPLVLYLVLMVIAGCASPVRFAAIGDTPYHESDSELQLLSETLVSIENNKIPFVVHVGDIFRSWTSCSPDLYEYRAHVFNKSPVPVLITIGDNEFNDCFDPVEAQGYFRKIILGTPPIQHTVSGFNNANEPKVEPIQVTRQKEMIENVTWDFRNITFIMLVLPDLPGNYPLSQEQISDILLVNTQFLKKYFQHAIQNKSHAVVLITHSEPALCHVPGCSTFNAVLKGEVKRFEKPVLLINGSNHNRTFMDGGYNSVLNWWHLRPGNTPEEHWPEISFSPKTRRFSVRWISGLEAEK